jgi:rhamnulokinase
MKHLAIDIGAESGRAFVGEREDGKLMVREVNRFANEPISFGKTLRWNDRKLLADVRKSIEIGDSLGTGSVGIDTWAVDFALLDLNGNIIDPPYHYRDELTTGMMEETFQKVSRAEIYKRTGIQFLRFNTLYQLFAMSKEGSPALQQAMRLLMIPDYLSYRVSGLFPVQTRAEYTNATTTQLVNLEKKSWDSGLLAQAGLKFIRQILPDLVQPGTILGPVRDSRMDIILPATHDTASAVVAVPCEDNACAWISSGTWSIMGVEVTEPNTSDEAFAGGFTNEGGVEGRIRLCKNVMGLWILQECRRAWSMRGDNFTYEDLNQMALESNSRGAFIDPDEELLLSRNDDMPDRLDWLLAATGFAPCESPGQAVRIILESLAQKYSVVFNQLQQLAGRDLQRIHVVGGGSQNALLNQLTADACGVPVFAGPVESAAIGNLLVQMLAVEEISDIGHGRLLVRDSFDVETFCPRK